MADLEIEMKAFVQSPDQVIEQLQAIGAQYLGDYHKIDDYYRHHNPESAIRDIRIRSCNREHLLTFKDKTIQQGMEYNREFETKVENPAVIIELLNRTGFSEFMKKIKIGSSWQYDDLHIELSEIVGLGHYIEIELVLPESGVDHQRLAIDARKKIETALLNLKVDLAAVESRSYLSMLQALNP